MSRNMMMTLMAAVLSLAVVSPVPAAAPAAGTVVEGQSVPGVDLGFLRAEVEAAYGVPDSCQDLAYYDGRRGIDGICDFDVNGGGQVTIYFRDIDGNPATGSPDDVVFFIRWSEAASGWTTTAGVNTTLGKEDPEAAAAAYPGAEVTRNQWGTIVRIKDYEQGIEIQRSIDFYSGKVSVSMAIFVPGPPPPPRVKETHVVAIDLSTSRRNVNAVVRVEDDLARAVSGAHVEATWTLPDNSTRTVSATTSGFGLTSFELKKARRGTYTLTIDNVVLDGYAFDSENSVLTASILKSK